MGDLSGQFNFYEIVGLAIPGMFLLIGYGAMSGAITATKDVADASLGSFAYVVVAAYVVGYLLQAVGRVMDRAYWFLLGGMPTDWVRLKEGRLFSPDQESLLIGQTLYPNPTKGQWRTVVALWSEEARTAAGNRLARFQGNNHLARGLLTATILLLIYNLWNAGGRPTFTTFVLLLAAGLAMVRMHTSALDYAREALRHRLKTVGGA